MSKREKEFRETVKRATIYPMMPSNYTAVERARLREFERKLITGSDNKDVKAKVDIEK